MNRATGRIEKTFTALAKQNRKALIPYVTAGFPFADVTPSLMQGMVEAGADVIELGVPFSDPMADGPVVQRAGERALANGVGMVQVLAMVRSFRALNTQTPVVLMGYANPIEKYDLIHGKGAFVRDAAASGVDGVLVVDYPPEACTQFSADLAKQHMDLIFLLAPTSTPERMALVGRIASGYVYYVSLKGVTGSGALDIDAVAQMIPKIKKHVSLPIGVGFGIRDAKTARAIAMNCDAVVIGSKIIELIEKQAHEKVVTTAAEFLREVRLALDKPF